MRAHRRSDQLDPAPAQHLRLRTQQQPPGPLIQMLPDQQQPRRNDVNIGLRQLRGTIQPNRTSQTYAILGRALKAEAAVGHPSLDSHAQFLQAHPE